MGECVQSFDAIDLELTLLCSGAFSNVYKAIDPKGQKVAGEHIVIEPFVTNAKSISVKVVRKYELNASQVRMISLLTRSHSLPLFTDVITSPLSLASLMFRGDLLS